MPLSTWRSYADGARYGDPVAACRGQPPCECIRRSVDEDDSAGAEARGLSSSSVEEAAEAVEDEGGR